MVDILLNKDWAANQLPVQYFVAVQALQISARVNDRNIFVSKKLYFYIPENGVFRDDVDIFSNLPFQYLYFFSWPANLLFPF